MECTNGMRKLILLGLMIFLFSSFATAALDNDNVLFAWNFDEGSGTELADATGHGRDGTIDGGTWAGGSFFAGGNALILDGSTDHIDVTGLETFNPNDNSTTFNFYFNSTSSAQQWWMDYGAGGTRYLSIDMNAEAGKMRARMRNGGTNFIVKAGDYDDGIVRMFTLTFDKTTDNMTIYIDGVKAATGSQNLGEVEIGDTTATFGDHEANPDNPVAGQIGCLSRHGVALSSADVLELYNSGTCLTYPYPSALTDTLNITEALPANDTTFNVPAVDFNLTANATYNFNASLYIDGVKNETKEYFNGSNVFVNFTGSFPDANYFYFIEVDDGTTNKNTTDSNYTIDTVDPDIVTADPALAVGSFVAVDTINTTIDYFNINLLTVNVTLNGVQIHYNGSVEQANYSVNVSEDLTGNTPGLQYIFTEACDLLNCVNATYNFTKLNFTTVSEAGVIEEQNSSFTLFVNSTNFTQISSVNATLNYNNTEYLVAGVFSGDYWLFNTSLLAPNLNTINETKSFYWNILPNQFEFNSTSESQTIYQLNLTDCSYGVPTLNFTVKDQSTLALLTNSSLDGFFLLGSDLVSYEKNNTYNSSGTASHLLCIYPPFGDYEVDAQIQYGSSGYATSLYYLTDYAVSAVTSQLDLLLASGTSVVTFTVLDENDNPLEGVYIQVLNYDIGTDTYTTTEILQTAGGQGQAFGNIVLNTEYYKFIISYQGNVVLETTPTILTGTERTFQVNLYGDYYATYNIALGVANTLTFDNTTNTFDFTFSDPSGKMHQACLKLVERSFKANTVINDTCITSTAGTILQTIPGDTTGNTYIATSYLLFDNPFVLLSFTESFKDEFKKFGLDGIFVTFLMVLLLALVGVWNPAIGGILAFLGLFAAVVLGIFQVSQPVLWSMAILAGITILRLNKN